MFDYGNATDDSQIKDDRHIKVPSSILTFDAYGNLTRSGTEKNEIGFSQDIPTLEEFDSILESFENKPKSPKNIPSNKHFDGGSSKKKKCDSKQAITLSELKSAFKPEFNATLNGTSRYGRTRKIKNMDEGFLSGTLNFNELRKITSPISNKFKHLSAGTTSDEDHSITSVDEGLPDISQNFDILTDKITNFSSEDEFQEEKKTKFRHFKLKIPGKLKSSLSKKRLSDPVKALHSNNNNQDQNSNNELLNNDITADTLSSPRRSSRHNITKQKGSPNVDDLSEHKEVAFQVNGETNSNKYSTSTENDDSDSSEKILDHSDESISTLASKALFSNSIDEDISILKKFQDTNEILPHNKTNLSEKLLSTKMVSEILDEKPAINVSNLNITKASDLKNETELKDSDPLKSNNSETMRSHINDMDIKHSKNNDNTENKEIKQLNDVSIVEEIFIEDAEEENFLKTLPCLHFIGDLVWVPFKKTPYWPGIICYPNNESEFTKIVTRSTSKRKIQKRQYHIKFLCDNHNRMWANSKNIFLFEGKDKLKSYLKTSKEPLNESGILALKYFRKNNPPLHKIERWNLAIEAASYGLTLNRYQRLEKLTEDENAKVQSVKRISSKKVPRKQSCKIEESFFQELINIKTDDIEDDGSDFSGFDDQTGLTNEAMNKNYLAGNIDDYIQKHMEILEDDAYSDRDECYSNFVFTKQNRITDYFHMKNQISDYSQLSSLKSKKALVLDNLDLDEGTEGTYRIVRNEKVCLACESVSLKAGGIDMVKCKGPCCGLFHLSCVGATETIATTFKCVNCTANAQECFICKASDGSIIKCTAHSCGKFYHDACVRRWPQVSKGRQTEKLVCPRHVCHMCAASADDMNDASARAPPYTRCVRCPTTYHTGELCAAAGIEEISLNYHICTKHAVLPKNKPANSFHCNVNWCFCCSKGGSLLLCDQCPAAFHAECMGITAPEGGYVCEDCENGKFPVYGDIVWAKVGIHRWWPGQVLHPRFIPDNIDNLPHVNGTFCVHFFGSDNYSWVARGKAFHYQEGDQGSKGNKQKLVEQQFKRALDEAQVEFLVQKEKREQHEQSRFNKGNLKPSPFVKIDTNKPVGNVRLGKFDPSQATKCDCDPYSENPCGTDDKCINRMLMIECIREVCSAADRCCNQRFQKRQYPTVFPFRTSQRGWGLKTKDFINKGDFVIEYVGELIDDVEFRRRICEMHEYNEENYYFLTVEHDLMVDAGPKGNLARFMNHSCQPNCQTQKWTVGADTRVGLFALHDIDANSEVNFNYNLESIGTDKKVCNCGAPLCSGFIGSKVKSETNNGSKKLNGKKMRKKKIKKEKTTDNDCFRCGTPGDLILCDNNRCPKGYHLDCLGLSSLPKGGWICPWHHCDECGNRAVIRCVACPNSFCRLHSVGQFHTGEVLVCNDHTEKQVLIIQSERTNESSPSVSEDETHKQNKSVCDMTPTVKKEPINTNDANKSLSNKDEDINPDQIIVKKRRGRPRKKLSTCEVIPSESLKETDADISITGKNSESPKSLVDDDKQPSAIINSELLENSDATESCTNKSSELPKSEEDSIESDEKPEKVDEDITKELNPEQIDDEAAGESKKLDNSVVTSEEDEAPNEPCTSKTSENETDKSVSEKSSPTLKKSDDSNLKPRKLSRTSKKRSSRELLKKKSTRDSSESNRTRNNRSSGSHRMRHRDKSRTKPLSRSRKRKVHVKSPSKNTTVTDKTKVDHRIRSVNNDLLIPSKTKRSGGPKRKRDSGSSPAAGSSVKKRRILKSLNKHPAASDQLSVEKSQSVKLLRPISQVLDCKEN